MMKLPIKEREFSTVIIILAVIVVIVLGVLQYRWSNQVSEATSIRLADSLQMSMINWHLDFFRAFSPKFALRCAWTRIPARRRIGISTRDDSRTGKRRRRIRIWFPGSTSCGSRDSRRTESFALAPSSQAIRAAATGRRISWNCAKNFGQSD